jgi:hypothetical protein
VSGFDTGTPSEHGGFYLAEFFPNALAHPSQFAVSSLLEHATKDTLNSHQWKRPAPSHCERQADNRHTYDKIHPAWFAVSPFSEHATWALLNIPNQSLIRGSCGTFQMGHLDN